MEKLGKYTVVEKIGVGGFGAVYKGYDPFIKRHIAIKTCNANDEETRTRFFHEAEIGGNLHHRNITTIHDFGVQDGLPYLIQEYLSGEDLDRKIKRRDTLPYPEKLYYLLQIARGLAYAHSKGVIHRDIKPANVRILEDGTAKIMDFGIAKLAQQDTGLTQTGMTLGTAAYLAPEQIRGEAVNHRTDIFSYGVLAYELIALERPFKGQQISQVIYEIINTDPKPITDFWPEAPPAIVQVIERCLDKDPTQRYADARELLRDLERLQKQGQARRQRLADNPTVPISRDADTPDGPRSDPSSSGVDRTLETPSGASRTSGLTSSLGSPSLNDSSVDHGRLGGDNLPGESGAPGDHSVLRGERNRPRTLEDMELAVTPPSDHHPTTQHPTPPVEVITRTPDTSSTARVALGVALLLVTLATGWWLGSKGGGEDTIDVEEPGIVDASDGGTSSAIDVVDVPPAAGLRDANAAASGNPSTGGADSGTGNTPAAVDETPPPPPPEPAVLTLQPPSWTQEMDFRLRGRSYPLIKTWTLDLPAGSYQGTFSIVVGSYREEKTVTVRLREGQKKTLASPILQPGALSARPLPGRPQGEIWIGSDPLGGSPLAKRLLAPGEHRLEIRPRGGDTQSLVRNITIESGKEVVLSFDLAAGRINVSQKKLRL